MEGSATVGTPKSAGLPNITGSFKMRPWVSSGGSTGSVITQVQGAFSATSGTDSMPAIDGHAAVNYFQTLSINASNSSTVYGNSTTVQPPALTMKPFIYTGKTSLYKWLRTA